MMTRLIPVGLHEVAVSGQTPSLELEKIKKQMEQLGYLSLDDEEPTEEDSFAGTINASFHCNGMDLSLSVDVPNEDSMLHFLVMLFGAMTM